MSTRLVGLLAIVFALALAGPAGAASIVYVCGSNLCRIDPKKPKHVTQLTRDGQAKGPVYRSPSLSTDGRKLSFVKGRDLYTANRNAKAAHKLEAADLAWLSPDGRHVAFVRSTTVIIDPGIFPCCRPPVYGQVPFLFLRDPSQDKAQTLARDVITAGWLRDRVMIATFREGGSGPVPDDVCLMVPPGADGVCERTIASDGGPRTLSAPVASPDGRYLAAVAEPWSDAQDYHQTFEGSIALFDPNTGTHLRDLTSGPSDGQPTFSPDGKQIAFTRGKDIYVVRVSGGPARRLRRGGADPAWGAR
jgi:Tol biopolymer transport system component